MVNLTKKKKNTHEENRTDQYTKKTYRVFVNTSAENMNVRIPRTLL